MEVSPGVDGKSAIELLTETLATVFFVVKGSKLESVVTLLLIIEKVFW